MRISDWSSDVCSSDLGYGLWRGPGEITRFMEEAHAPLGPTLHRLSNFVVDGDDSRATARTYVDALLMPASPDGTIHRGIGYYADELIRSDDGWKIRRSRFNPVITGERRGGKEGVSMG